MIIFKFTYEKDPQLRSDFLKVSNFFNKIFNAEVEDLNGFYLVYIDSDFFYMSYEIFHDYCEVEKYSDKFFFFNILPRYVDRGSGWVRDMIAYFYDSSKKNVRQYVDILIKENSIYLTLPVNKYTNMSYAVDRNNTNFIDFVDICVFKYFYDKYDFYRVAKYSEDELKGFAEFLLTGIESNLNKKFKKA